MDSYKKKIYDEYASVFNKSPNIFDHSESERWGKAYNHYLKNWLPENKDANIIDLACGNGKLIDFFLKKNYLNVTGVDISKEQVDISKQISSNIYEDDIIDFLKNKKNKYDLITAFDLIEHLKKDQVLIFIEYCYNALKPGGRIIIQTINGESPFVGHLRYSDFTHEICYTAISVSRLFEMFRFSKTEVKEQSPIFLNYSISSTLRAVIWKFIRLIFIFYNLVETGSKGTKIFTRNLIFTAIKPIK